MWATETELGHGPRGVTAALGVPDPSPPDGPRPLPHSWMEVPMGRSSAGGHRAQAHAGVPSCHSPPRSQGIPFHFLKSPSQPSPEYSSKPTGSLRPPPPPTLRAHTGADQTSWHPGHPESLWPYLSEVRSHQVSQESSRGLQAWHQHRGAPSSPDAAPGVRPFDGLAWKGQDPEG